ncbi:response regulator [Pseudomonas sp. MT3]|nr:response regulator [uncultured Pseudomonas sp.]
MARIALVGSVRSKLGASLKRLNGHQLVAQPTLARQALAELRADQFDLLVVMLELSDIHGLELLEMLRRNGQLPPSIPVLACSNLHSAMNIRRAMHFGASGLLFLNDCPALLEHIIDAVLQGGSIFPEHARLPVDEDARLHHALRFSTQQVAILHGLRHGRSSASLADFLNIPTASVSYCKRQMMRKLKAAALDDLIGISQEIGLI